jgi:GNAT superfamily N-acetyltransferase
MDAGEQSARFAALDPALPPVADLPAGERLTATVGDRTLTAMLERTRHRPDVWPSLWSALETWRLLPMVGHTGAAGMDALLRAWLIRMRRESPGPDSACQLTWPSRDTEVSRVLLDHGFAPMNVIAIRANRPGEPGAAGGVVVREAGRADMEEIVRLRLAELRYSSLVGPATLREHSVELLAGDVVKELRFGGRIWLAEADGVAVGVACCGWASPVPGTEIGGRLPEGRWGYIGTLSVAPEVRGGGVGRALMAVAHRELNLDDVRGTFLYYHPPNPLSSVFWHRQGYRPLWTTWELRPAGALR